MIGLSNGPGLLSLTFIKTSVHSYGTATEQFFSSIRRMVRAVIFQNGELLAQVKEKSGQIPYLILPDGEQEPDETAVQALGCECAEEVGIDDIVGPVLHVVEMFEAKVEGTRHQLKLLFACEIAEDNVSTSESYSDPSQIETSWASPVTRLVAFRSAHAATLGGGPQLYLGVLHG